MRNHYESAEIVDIGRAQDVVLGNKLWWYEWDILTGQYMSLVVDQWTDD